MESVDPRLWFITPVYRRFMLTSICMEQRRRMIEALPFEANVVIVGDDSNLEVAEAAGFHTVEMNNQWIGRKFNAGYTYALEHGATHCMPIGSDSFLHQDAIKDIKFSERGATSLVGLSSVSPDGEMRIDLQVKYPAGFGVGMIYPEWCLNGGEACVWTKQRSIDTSTWDRCGRDKVSVEFQDLVPYSYVNFHSTDVQITDFNTIKGAYHKRMGMARHDGLDALDTVYDADIMEALRTMYALRGLEVFLNGRPPPEPHQPVAGANAVRPDTMRGQITARFAGLLDG